MANGNLKGRFEAIGYKVVEVDGHNMEQLKEAYSVKEQKRPICIIAKTTKGKGVSFMEDKVEWHGQVISKDLCDDALKELEGVM